VSFESEHAENVAVAKELLAFYREHAAELRAKGVDVDRMIADSTGSIGEMEAAGEGLRRAQREEKTAASVASMLRAETHRLAAEENVLHDAASVDYLKAATGSGKRRGPNRPGQGG